MPKIVKPLTTVALNRITKPGWYAVGGVAGLLLQIRNPTREGAPLARSWILRVRVGETRDPIGLGSYPQVSLAEAREQAGKLVIEARQGVNLKAKKWRLAVHCLRQPLATKHFRNAQRPISRLTLPITPATSTANSGHRHSKLMHTLSLVSGWWQTCRCGTCLM